MSERSTRWRAGTADGRRLVVHREPTGDRYASVASLTDADTVTAALLPATVAVADLLPPAR